jgi:excisionase family DNA binding protein
MMATSPTPHSLLSDPVAHGDSENAPARLLTVGEVAEQLRLGRTKVYGLIKQEGLPVVRFGRRVRISQDDLSTWLAKRKSPGNAWNACEVPERRDESEDTI